MINKEIVNRFIKKLEDLAAKIECINSDDDEYELILQLDHIILNDVCTEEEENIILSSMNEAARISIQNLYVNFETKIEMSIDDLISNHTDSQKFLFCNTRNLIVPYFKRYRDLVLRENNNLHVTERDKVLWIGSGPFPSSSILLNDLTRCEIHCVDISEKAINNSKRIIKLLGKEKLISVNHQNGIDVDVENYSVIIIGVLAAPIDPIMKNIFEHMNSNTKILKRVTYGLRQLIYPTTQITVKAKYSLDNDDRAIGDQTISHIIYNNGH
ncbi:hypothetical protein NL50_01000 [Clostridium acetobutylicum]|nr:hypothetical protein NL50_01000 [Clostridium acetobutylicum]